MIHKLKEFIRQRYNISFSKAGDDIQLMKLINNNTPGAYMDIGCWHPVNASNSYYFYLRKWKGICVDPNPELGELYKKYRPTDNFINAGIGSSTTTSLEYYMLEESSMNTFSYDFITTKNLASKILGTKKVPVIPLQDLLAKHLNPKDRLDFFDIDVEGFDLEVLKTNDWSKYRPKIIVIESDISIEEDLSSEMVSYLKQKEYRLIGKSIIQGNLGNLFFINK